MVNLGYFVFLEDLTKLISIGNICFFDDALEVLGNLTMAKADDIVGSIHFLKFRN